MKLFLCLALLSMARLACPAQQKVFELPMDSADAGGLQVYQAYDPATARIYLTFARHFKVDRFMLPGGDNPDPGRRASFHLLSSK